MIAVSQRRTIILRRPSGGRKVSSGEADWRGTVMTAGFPGRFRGGRTEPKCTVSPESAGWTRPDLGVRRGAPPRGARRGAAVGRNPDMA
ncbi:hypothetical protein GCM10010232_53240 [Streptomyces amakusaensis]